MKKRIRLAITLVTVAVVTVTGTVAAYPKETGTTKMEYDRDNGMIYGTFYTESDEKLNCIEVFTSQGYLEKGGQIDIVIGNDGMYTLKESGLTGNDPSGNTKAAFGATLPLTQYPVECHVLYAELPEKARVRWGVALSGAGTLINECLVVKAEVPETLKDGTISTGEPEEILTYFISSDNSKIKTEEVQEIITAYMAKDKEGNITDYRPADGANAGGSPAKLILIILGIAAAGAAVYFYRKRKRDKAEEDERKEERLRKKNEKIAVQKEEEGEHIREYMQTKISTYKDHGYDDGFDDDEDSTEPETKKKPDTYEDSGIGVGNVENPPYADETPPYTDGGTAPYDTAPYEDGGYPAYADKDPVTGTEETEEEDDGLNIPAIGFENLFTEAETGTESTATDQENPETEETYIPAFATESGSTEKPEEEKKEDTETEEPHVPRFAIEIEPIPPAEDISYEDEEETDIDIGEPGGEESLSREEIEFRTLFNEETVETVNLRPRLKVEESVNPVRAYVPRFAKS